MVLRPGDLGPNGDVLTPRGRTVAAVSPWQIRPGLGLAPSLPEHLRLSPSTRLTPQHATALVPSPRPTDAVAAAALLPESPLPPRGARLPPPSAAVDEHKPVSYRLALRSDEHALIAAAVAKRDGRHRTASGQRRSDQRDHLAGHARSMARRATAVRTQHGAVSSRVRDEASALAASAPPTPPTAFEPMKFVVPVTPVERPPSLRGGGGLVHLTEEEMMDRKEKEFGVWFARFMREEQLEAFALPSELLPEDERRALDRRELLDEMALNTSAVSPHPTSKRAILAPSWLASVGATAWVPLMARLSGKALGCSGLSLSPPARRA